MYKFFFIFIFVISIFSNDKIKYKYDDAHKIAINKRIKGSHLKVYMPSIPYANIMRLINGTLVRLSESSTGWEYYLAYKHQKINELTYDFWLRKDVKYQDGTKFNADSVIENFANFKKGAFTYTNIHNTLDYVEKINEYKVRIHLKKPYGMLFNDLARINLYTKRYLKKYPWLKSIVAQNTQVVGAHGSGPYIMVEGYATGLTQSEKIVLKANPYYHEKNKPYIEKITIFTQLTTKEVIEKISKKEGELDIAYIPFDKKTEIVNSEYAKLITSPSNSTFTVHINLIKKESKLQNKKVRQALNDALNQDNLIKFAFKNEAFKSPFLLSSNAYYAKDISKKYLDRKSRFTKKELFEILNGLELKIITQDRFMFVWKGIEYQLKKYGVSFNYDITLDESYVLKKLLTNRENNYDWDLLIWGSEDWYGHPWTVFFTLYTKNKWSAILKDNILDDKLENLFKIDNLNKKFQEFVNELLLYNYDKAYTLVLPSPKTVLALNKEVLYTPSKMALFPLWNAKITPYHYSIRKDEKLPRERLEFLYPTRLDK